MDNEKSTPESMCPGALDLLMAETELTPRKFRQPLCRLLLFTASIALDQLSAEKSPLLQFDLGYGTIFLKHMHVA